MATLTLPEIHSDPSGWGPLHDWQPESFNEFNIGYAPFSKLEKLGKAADWNNLGRTPARQNQGASPFEEDEQGEFFVVDSRQTRSVKSGFTQRPGQNKARQRTRGGGHWQDQQQGRAKGRQQQQQRGGQRGGRGQGGRRGGGYNAQQHQRKTATSVDVEPSWGDAVCVIDFNNLSSSYVDAVPVPETISSHGSIRQYNNANDKLSVRQEKPLERGYAAEMKSHNLTASEDPVMKDLVEKKTANVYVTDSVLVVLMSLLRSAYAFDVVVTKDESGNIFFDKRDDFLFDFISVNENSNEPPYDESDVACNTVEALHKEATTANFNFSQQVLYKEGADKQTKFDQPNPFVSTGEHAPSVAYIYKTFDLGDDVKICVRTEIDSFEIVQIKNQTKTRNLLVKSLIEYDQKITGGWRVKLESQKAGCFATELKSNNCKLTKWLLQAHLAGVPHLKIGWVSRTNGTKDPYVHSVLAVTNHPVNELTSELGLDFTQVWGALKYIIMTLQKYSEGSYIILRDPTKKTVYIYKTLNDEFKRKK